jgi:HEAT repeat protein
MGPFSDGWSTEQVDGILARANADELLYVPIAVSMNAEAFGPQRAEDICVLLYKHQDPRVRGNAVKGLGHLARITGQFTREDSIECVRAGITDPDELVRSHAQDASSDIYMFTGMKISE